MLEVVKLNAGYGGSQALFDVDLHVASGEVVTLLGRNGMGKSTTINVIAGLLKVASGDVHFDGASMKALPAYRVARKGIGLVPEGRQIFPNLTVRENLVATAANRFNQKNFWHLESVLELFPSLRDRLSSLGRLLSGGEQQMLAVGRALMTNPRLLILDEATEGLAPLIREEIWQCLTKVKATGQAILVTDKNIAALAKIADRHYFLERGRVVFECDSKTLLQNKEIQHRYLSV
ncbi:MAG: ABC transporter ATP-binding protein [Xanthobacteraceae bacterium]|nr:ABC transporter ATP-binding protein [Xanthobacteraceae bacterium]